MWGIDYNDDASLDPILSLRKMKVPVRFNSNLSAGCEEMVTGLLGADDLADVRNAVEEIATYGTWAIALSTCLLYTVDATDDRRCRICCRP